jgi:negative regulator of sigma E activity
MPLALSRSILVMLELGAALFSTAAQAISPEAAADSLVARVQEARQVKGVRGTAVLIHEDLASGMSTSRRLAIISATREGTTTVLYQARATAKMTAAAVLITLSSGQPASGYVFSGPDAVLPLTPALLEQPFLATDLKIGDLTDDFLAWPSQRQVGSERLLGRDCAIIESRPQTVARPAIVLVRSWIARALALPLKVEKYGADGALRRRFIVERLARLDKEHWSAAVLTVYGANARTRTKLKMVKGDRHAEVPPQEFAIETIRRSLRPRGAAKPPEGRIT